MPSSNEGPVMMATPGRYEIHLRGKVSDRRLDAFDGMQAIERPAETVLRGPIPDQAALHDLLKRAHAMGIELLSVRCLSDDPREDDDAGDP
jgi:hypothetical protein